MAIYSFKITKGKYQLDLSTTDKELLVEQFELWVRQAGEYNRKRKAKECKELVNNQIKAEEEVTKKNIENHLARRPKTELPKIDENKENKKEDSTATVEKDEKQKNLDIFYSPQQQETVSKTINNSSSTGFFDSILENSINNPKT